MFKNVATKIVLFAFDATTGLPKTGDAANITMYVQKDYGSVTALADTSATEVDATNSKGNYVCDVTQSETNADVLIFSGKSSTSNVVVVSQKIFTTPNRFSSLSIDTSGIADANVQKWLGTTCVTPVVAGVPLASTHLLKYRNTAQAGGAASVTLHSGAAIADCEEGDMLYIESGTGAGGSNIASASMNNTTKVVPCYKNWRVSPASGSVIQVWKAGGAVPADASLLASASSVSSLFNTPVTESYAADGAAPTVAQSLLLIQQMLTEMSISGTTMTIKKLDGTTTAMTLTLNDPSNPTSVTRTA